jgi:hypothetical protein
MNTLVKAYENLLVDNVGTVRSVESGLRNLTWLLPGRFEDADVASEGRMSFNPFVFQLMGSVRFIIGGFVLS